MASGSLTIGVRPLRIAFIVDPADSDGLYRVLQINSSLWGGVFNPIVPYFKRIPRNWERHRFGSGASPQAIVEGYLDGFDPDFVVPVGDCVETFRESAGREIIQEESILRGMDISGVPAFGVGLPEVFKDFMRKELRFERTDDLRVLLPILPRKFRVFLSSVLGSPSIACSELLERLSRDHARVSKSGISIGQYIDAVASNMLFPRRLTHYAMDFKRLREPVVFLCDASKNLDVIDYWNLRAAGYEVFPVAIQVAKLNSCLDHTRQQIDRNYFPMRYRQGRYNRTTLMQSRNVSDDAVSSFVRSLNLNEGESPSNPRLVTQHWYPRLWNAWARENAFEGVDFQYSRSRELRIDLRDSRLELDSEQPEIGLVQGLTGNPRFANDFSFRFFGVDDEPLAEVFPERVQNLYRAIGAAGHRSWRFSKFGPTFMPHWTGDHIRMDIPKAEAVMSEFLRDRGWTVELSPAGRIAKQLYRQLGGMFGTWWLMEIPVQEQPAFRTMGSHDSGPCEANCFWRIPDHVKPVDSGVIPEHGKPAFRTM